MAKRIPNYMPDSMVRGMAKARDRMWNIFEWLICQGLANVSVNPLWFAGWPSVKPITGMVRGIAKRVPNYRLGSQDGQGKNI